MGMKDNTSWPKTLQDFRFTMIEAFSAGIPADKKRENIGWKS